VPVPSTSSCVYKQFIICSRKYHYFRLLYTNYFFISVIRRIPLARIIYTGVFLLYYNQLYKENAKKYKRNHKTIVRALRSVHKTTTSINMVYFLSVGPFAVDENYLISSAVFRVAMTKHYQRHMYS